MSRQSFRKDVYNRHAYIESFRHETLRLANHDYRGPGVYHVITCAQGIGGRGPLFEHPVLRKLMQTHWLDLPDRYATLQLDEFVIMPDHLHFLIWPNKWPDRAENAPHLGEIMRTCKSSVSVDWLAYVKENHPDWSAKIWQGDYFERVVRIDQLERTRRYLRDNPDIPDKLYKHMGWTKNRP